MRYGVGVHNPPGFYVLAPVSDGEARLQLTSIEEDACSFSSLMSAIMFAAEVRKGHGFGTHVYVSGDE